MTLSYEKVIPHLLTEVDITLQNNERVRVVKTKKEVLFESFKGLESISSKIVLEVADNPILLKFLFLESDSNLTGYGPSGIVMSYPFCLDPSYNFAQSLEERADYKQQNEKL